MEVHGCLFPPDQKGCHAPLQKREKNVHLFVFIGESFLILFLIWQKQASIAIYGSPFLPAEKYNMGKKKVITMRYYVIIMRYYLIIMK